MRIKNNSAVLLASLIAGKAFACVGCGQESSTLKMLLVGSCFALLPMSLAAGIWWIVYKESRSKGSND